MARMMWANDEKHVYRAVIRVTYPDGWKIYGFETEGRVETTYCGPYLGSGSARASVSRRKREIYSHWRSQARNNPELPMPVVEFDLEASELHWKMVSK